MRKVQALVVLTIAVLGVAGAASGDRTARRVSVPGRLSVSVPVGWHMLRGWLSDVTDPAPRLALASFPARLSRHTCECGSPNVVNFPPDGAFVFVWEYLPPFLPQLARTPHRPARFHLGGGGGARQSCDGPNGEFYFKDSGRVLQVEVYLGAGAGPALRGRVAATLDSLRVAADA